jgi:4-amino-4-deoxy-L-arabinose transferase-like glycosyltransferase
VSIHRANWRAVLLLWCVPVALVGLFGRSFYTPDEPREAALAVAIATQAQHVVPELGGRPFLEKPPLLYWLSAAAMRLAGQSPAVARAPLLLYLALSIGALAALAARAAGPTAGYVAGTVTASALLLYQVEIWLATDALLLGAVALALFGLYVGYTAPDTRRRLAGYALFHTGLLLAFFAKNLAGWMVPVFALLTLVVWDRRYRELLRAELWLPVPFLAVLVVAWVWGVASLPDGRAALRVLFIDNLLGRAVPMASPDGFAYTTAHRNAPGKYLLELPVYLLPWTFLAVAALRHARLARTGAPLVRTAYRLALGACVPALVLLSFAATARGIYLAPALLGLALLIGLWAAVSEQHDRFDRLCVILTVVLVALEALLVVAAALLTSFAPHWRTPTGALLGLVASLGGAAALAGCLVAARSMRRREEVGRPIAALSLAVAATLAVSAGPLYLRLNDFMDLRASAQRLAPAIGPAGLVLLYPDETTEALVQLYLPAVPIRASVLPGAGVAAAAAAIRAAPGAQVLVLVPDRAHWGASAWLAYLGYGGVVPRQPSLTLPSGLPPLRLEQLITRPGGRSYALLSSASAAPPSGAGG